MSQETGLMVRTWISPDSQARATERAVGLQSVVSRDPYRTVL